MPNEPKTLESWLRNTWKDFSIMIRVEAADAHGVCECVTCGLRKYWNDDIHCGHCLAARYMNSPLKFEETDVAPQCRNCNTDGRVSQWRPHASKKAEDVHGLFIEYTIDTHGRDELARLRLLRNTGKMATGQARIDELRVMRAEFKRRAAAAMEEKGL
jgi:hypothetical protein